MPPSDWLELWSVLSNLLEPGQVLAGAPTTTPVATVVWALEVPLRPQWLMDFVAVGDLSHPQSMTR